jgi:hypothetical protein
MVRRSGLGVVPQKVYTAANMEYLAKSCDTVANNTEFGKKNSGKVESLHSWSWFLRQLLPLCLRHNPVEKYIGRSLELL